VLSAQIVVEETLCQFNANFLENIVDI